MNRKEEIKWVSSGQRAAAKRRQTHAKIYDTNLHFKGSQDLKKKKTVKTAKSVQKTMKPERGFSDPPDD